MALARFDWRNDPIKLTFASVGNIEVKVFGNLTPYSFKVQRGVIGFNAPDPVVAHYDWSSDYVFILHTDGLKTNWNWNDFPELATIPATQASQRLLQNLAKDNDDATVIVISKKFLQMGDKS